MAGEFTRRCVVYLPEEVQQKILLGLPCKSLVRFESVCKKWLDMLHSRGFIDLYGQRMSDPNFLQSMSYATLFKMFPGLIIDGWAKLKQTKPDLKYVIRVLGPLNGIYCVSSKLHDFGSHQDSYILATKIALCNPSTRELKLTNPFPRKFHPLLSNLSGKLHLGFGHVSNSSFDDDDYRVVVIVEHGGDRDQTPSYLVFVYSVQSGEWKKIVDYEAPPGTKNYGKRKATGAFNTQGRRILDLQYPIEGCPQRFLQGCYYWMAAVTAGGAHLDWDVLSFNFAHQSFKLIRGPPPFQCSYDLANGDRISLWPDVVVLHAHLAVIQCYNVVPNDSGVRRTVEVVVWMMMEYGVEAAY